MGCCTSVYVSQDVFYPLVYVSAQNLQLPQLKPPSCRRNKIFSPAKYPAIEKHLQKAVPENILYSNFQTVARYVTKPASDDVARLWALYQWLAMLNSKMVLTDFDRSPNADSPLGYISKIENGERSYAHLFAALARALDIPCVIINGVTKNASYELGETIDRSKMASEWNAVYVQGSWRLVDTFWGSHSITGRRFSNWAIVDADGDVITVKENTSDGKVRQSLKDFFFLTDPDMLICTHLPDDPSWQLLPEPVPEAHFTSCVYLRDRYFQLGCSVLSEDCTELHLRPSEGEQLIQLTLPKSRSIAFDFKYLLFKDTSSSIPNKDLRGTVFNELKPDLLSYTIKFPFRGRYRFDIFGVDTLEQDAFDLIASYVVEVDTPCRNFEMLPDSPTIGWGPGVETTRYGLQPITHNYSIIDTQDGKFQIRFKMKEQLTFAVALKHKDHVCCELEGNVCLSTDSGELVVDVRLPTRGQFAVKIFAKHGDEPGRLDNVCNYLARCTGDPAQPVCFPLIHNDVLGTRYLIGDYFDIQATSHVHNIIKTDKPELEFRFATHSHQVEVLGHLHGPGIDGHNVTGIMKRTVTNIHTNFSVKLPCDGEYALNIFAKVPNKSMLYPVECYMIRHNTPGDSPPRQAEMRYITGEQMSIEYKTTTPAVVSACFEKYYHSCEPGGSIDSAIDIAESGVGLNLMVTVSEDDMYKLDIYEECSGCLVLMAAHRLMPIEYDTYDEQAVADRRSKARAMEATRRREAIVTMAASRPPTVFNRDSLRGRLKMTIVARNLQFAEAALCTCQYHNYTDDDLVPQVEKLAMFLSKQKELGKAIRNAIQSDVTVPLERVLDYVEQTGMDKEMGFLVAVGRNILVKRLSEKIRKMDQTTVAEVKSYSAPPRAAQEVMKASLLLLGHKDWEIKDWDSIRHIIGNTQKMKQRLKTVDVDAIDDNTAEVAERLVSVLTRDEVTRTSDVVDSFYSWSKNMIKLKFANRAEARSEARNNSEEDHQSVPSEQSRDSPTI